jgi:hypothetical protein
MLTACWQQGFSTSGQHLNKGNLSNDDPLWHRPVVGDMATADTMVAAGGN